MTAVAGQMGARAPAGLWLAGGAASVLAHGGLLALFMLSVAPDPIPSQPMPESRLDIEAYEVEASEAAAGKASGEAAAEARAEGASLSGAAIPVVAARPHQPKAETAPALTGRKAPLPPVAAETMSPTLAVARTADLAAITAPVTPAAMVLQSGQTPSEAAVVALPPKTPAIAVPAEAATLAPSAPADLSTEAPDLPPPSEHATAALAWSGAGDGVVDPVSLAAIEAFMRPGDLSDSAASAGDVRDGVEALLASVPCARMQTTFIPETGTLELRGHVPEEGLRGPVLAALQAQMGSAIPVSDKLLILPRPQCGALSGIAAVGLPQSTEQLTNPRVVGADAHVREYRYTEGQRLTFELTAPDYDGVVYVDYFDADGMVIHLQPNEIVPLLPHPAKAQLTVGIEEPGRPSLNITIAPPYGQEIAVAFATSVPLYEGVRPLSEPAGPYLEFLRERVAEARTRNPGFKGEWVYFFISTSAG